jgi:hypothetical protein
VKDDPFYKADVGMIHIYEKHLGTLTPINPFNGFKLKIERSGNCWVSTQIRIHESSAWLASGADARGRDIITFLSDASKEMAQKLGCLDTEVSLLQGHDMARREYFLQLSVPARCCPIAQVSQENIMGNPNPGDPVFLKPPAIDI